MITNAITYTINNRRQTLYDVPVLFTDSSSELYGQISVLYPSDSTNISTAQVFKCSAPTSSEHRYIRSGSDLYDPKLLNYTITRSSNTANLSFRFAPGDATASSGEFYSLEFNVNGISPKVIVRIKDKLK